MAASLLKRYSVPPPKFRPPRVSPGRIGGRVEFEPDEVEARAALRERPPGSFLPVVDAGKEELRLPEVIFVAARQPRARKREEPANAHARGDVVLAEPVEGECIFECLVGKQDTGVGAVPDHALVGRAHARLRKDRAGQAEAEEERDGRLSRTTRARENDLNEVCACAQDSNTSARLCHPSVGQRFVIVMSPLNDRSVTSGPPLPETPRRMRALPRPARPAPRPRARPRSRSAELAAIVDRDRIVRSHGAVHRRRLELEVVAGGTRRISPDCDCSE